MSAHTVSQKALEQNNEALGSIEKESDSLLSHDIDATIEWEQAQRAVHTAETKNIINRHIITAVSVSLVPVPLFDIAALTATQLHLLRSLSEHYNLSFDETHSKSLITPLIGGSLPVLSMLGLSSLAKFIPGIGSVVGSASLSIVAGAITYAMGRVFSAHFMAGGTLQDFSPKDAQAVFMRELEQGKVIVKKMKADK